MITKKYFSVFKKHTMSPTTLCSFCHKNFSGDLSGPSNSNYWARLVCNHSYCYAFRRIAQTDSLSHKEIYLAQNSAFL